MPKLLMYFIAGIVVAFVSWFIYEFIKVLSICQFEIDDRDLF